MTKALNRTVYLYFGTKDNSVYGKNGAKPTIQDEQFWKSHGYVYTAYLTFDAITLSKMPIDLDRHAGYIPEPK